MLRDEVRRCGMIRRQAGSYGGTNVQRRRRGSRLVGEQVRCCGFKLFCDSVRDHGGGRFRRRKRSDVGQNDFGLYRAVCNIGAVR